MTAIRFKSLVKLPSFDQENNGFLPTFLLSLLKQNVTNAICARLVFVKQTISLSFAVVWDTPANR